MRRCKRNRQQHLKAEPYQHTKEREGHANGYKPKTVHTRVRSIIFAIPEVREGGFYPEALGKGLRSEQAPMLALAEMYVQGVSTRKVKAVTEKLCEWPCLRPSSVIPRRSWMQNWRSGATDRRESISTCSWMPSMIRHGSMDRFAVLQFYRRWASIWSGNERS